MKRIVSFLACSLCCATAVLGQDIHFSQFYENATLRNPALTGIFSGDYKLSVNYRNQWSGFAVPFQTAVVSAETKVLLHEQTGDYLSFGLTAVHDKAGSIDFTGTSAYGAVNYNKSLGDGAHSYLSVGLAGAYIQRAVDPGKMRFASQFVNGGYSSNNASGENLGTTSIHHYDASAGVSFNSSIGGKVNYYLGVAGYHVAKPKETFLNQDLVRLTTRWSGNFGLRARLADKMSLTVHANYQYQDPYREIMLGGLLGYQAVNQTTGQQVVVSAGCFYRVGDAVIPTVRLDYKTWSLTASYDVAMSGKRIYFNNIGGYEMSLTLRGNYHHASPSSTACPRFESLEADYGY